MDVATARLLFNSGRLCLNGRWLCCTVPIISLPAGLCTLEAVAEARLEDIVEALSHTKAHR